MIDNHLSELMRQCADATPLKRLNVTEREEVFRWRGRHNGNEPVAAQPFCARGKAA